jgi:glutathione S-transferase
MQLVIANKAYSSWSLRPWLVARHFEIPFEEIQVLLDQPDTSEQIRKFSPSGRVPCLIDGDLAVWDSLAIIEYLAESYPDRPIWPADRQARAVARSISAEMHSGFQALRSACPMNLKKRFAYRDWGRPAQEDAVRIVELWRDARSRFGAGGPFLFGAFSAADAMYAPVVTRFDTYGWPVEPETRSYIDAILALPAFVAWRQVGEAETWIVPSDEIE